MKKNLHYASLAILAAFTLSAAAQGTFQNLDFEMANVPTIPTGQFGSFVPISSGLPGWNGYLGANQITQVLQNNYTLGAANISILGPNWNSGGIIEGSYTALLQPGLSSGPQGSNVDVAIAQTSLIPSTAQSLMFKSDAFSHLFAVFISGQSAPVFSLSNGPGYILYGADVSSFAGQSEELRITALFGLFDNHAVLLDSIVFSTQPIPEPSILVLCALGSLLSGWRLRREKLWGS